MINETPESPMLKGIAAILVSLTICGPYPAAAQGEITPEGIARTVSSNFFIAEVCRNYFSVDRDLAFNFAKAAAEVGNKIVGVKPFGKLSQKEIQRRAQEIQLTGASQWCTYQRAHMNQMGSKVFLD